jgi:hypothetical protein
VLNFWLVTGNLSPGRWSLKAVQKTLFGRNPNGYFIVTREGAYAIVGSESRP